MSTDDVLFPLAPRYFYVHAFAKESRVAAQSLEEEKSGVDGSKKEGERLTHTQPELGAGNREIDGE